MQDSSYKMKVLGIGVADSEPVHVYIDYYAIANAMDASEEVKHTLKKILALGNRVGGKDYRTDLNECKNQIGLEETRLENEAKLASLPVVEEVEPKTQFTEKLTGVKVTPEPPVAEEAKPEPMVVTKYEIGSMIKILSNTTSPDVEEMYEMVGEEFEVLDYDNNDSTVFVNGWWFNNCDLELANSKVEEVKPALLDIGDTVLVLDPRDFPLDELVGNTAGMEEMIGDKYLVEDYDETLVKVNGYWFSAKQLQLIVVEEVPLVKEPEPEPEQLYAGDTVRVLTVGENCRIREMADMVGTEQVLHFVQAAGRVTIIGSSGSEWSLQSGWVELVKRKRQN